MRNTDFSFNSSVGMTLFFLGIPLILGIFLLAATNVKSHLA